MVKNLFFVAVMFGSSASLAFADNSKACKDDAMMFCVAAVGSDTSLECEEGQRPVDQCEDGDVGRCTWDSGSSTELQWRLYAGSPVLSEAAGICAEGGGQWSTR